MKKKFFIFSDESGTWHEPDGIYVRSWIVIEENEYNILLRKVDEVASFIQTKELKWLRLAKNKRFMKEFDNVDFRIFITVSSPKDIDLDNKYTATKNFESSMAHFNFGSIDKSLQTYIKGRFYNDLKAALFLHFYEKCHIENAKERIEEIIKPEEYDIIYRIDPPQLPRSDWAGILKNTEGHSLARIEFPNSKRTQGIQFADVVAGCFKSFLIEDSEKEEAEFFLKKIKNRLIAKSRTNPNPNLIFFGEINTKLKERSAAVWHV